MKGLGWVEGFEPSATGTTIRRSTKLSYTHRVRELQFTNSVRGVSILWKGRVVVFL